MGVELRDMNFLSFKLWGRMLGSIFCCSFLARRTPSRSSPSRNSHIQHSETELKFHIALLQSHFVGILATLHKTNPTWGQMVNIVVGTTSSGVG